MESFLENLKHQAQCSLCNETLIEPKLLQCFHTFCKSCIKRHAQLLNTEQVNIFKCPQCASQTLLQNLNDVEDLQISPVHSRILQVLSLVENQKVCSVSASHSQALWHCFDCERSICEECLKGHSVFTKNHQVVSLSDLKKEDIEMMLKNENPCKTHDNQVVNFHCQDCNILLCVLCFNEHHHNHKTTSLQEFFAIEKDLLSKNLEDIDKMSTDQNEKKQQEEIALVIKSVGEKAQEQVKELTKKLFKALTDNEHQLLNEIQKSIKKADMNLRIISHTTEAREFMNNLIEIGTASNMAADNQQIDSSEKIIYDPFPGSYTNGIIFEELCKQMSIMHDFIIKLIKQNEEESYECLYKLLFTIGKDLDHTKVNFQVPVGSPQMQNRPTLSYHYNNMNPQMNFPAYLLSMIPQQHTQQQLEETKEPQEEVKKEKVPSKDETWEDKDEKSEVIFSPETEAEESKDGPRSYDRDFLLQFQFNPICMAKPEGLPDIEVMPKSINTRQPLKQPNYQNRMGGGGVDFMPSYMRPPGRGLEETKEPQEEVKEEKVPSEDKTWKDEDETSEVICMSPGAEAEDSKDGRISYDRDFLLQFQFNPICTAKPEGLPDIEIVLNNINTRLPLKQPTYQNRMGGGGVDFMPSYMRAPGRRQIHGLDLQRLIKLDQKMKRRHKKLFVNSVVF